jgi:diketogulonate reductase-like aldo/keto reductase
MGNSSQHGDVKSAYIVQRGDIFLTTKLWSNAHHPDDVEPALDESLTDLQTDYVDLLPNGR